MNQATTILTCSVGKKVLDGASECLMQFSHSFTMEADHDAQAKYATDKNVVAFVELDAGCIAFVGHGVHGFTPTRSSNSRASSTW
ncbi:hypothetical protein [Aromatoleum aromaticum]|uniref:hypothetical protein n=1 Tax=Aromatoleum aromaticum TaxID=551760 RepID=UPI00203AE2BA|nr:hypothetical protein [Aromatoleum aromaticum]